jgi:glyceraldehyde 3-phosphate dehydrogenase
VNPHNSAFFQAQLQVILPMTDQNRPRPDDYFGDWKQREALAEAMIPLVGKLYRENNVACMVVHW